MDMCSANIHGSGTTMDQSEIDNLIGSDAVAETDTAQSGNAQADTAQADIDALFD